METFFSFYLVSTNHRNKSRFPCSLSSQVSLFEAFFSSIPSFEIFYYAIKNWIELQCWTLFSLFFLESHLSGEYFQLGTIGMFLHVTHFAFHVMTLEHDFVAILCL